MLAFSPFRLRRILLPATFGIYLCGLVISTLFFFRGRAFEPTAMLLSDLASPQSNPHGYLALMAATILSSLLLIPVAMTFHRSAGKSAFVPWATAIFCAGIAAALLVAALAPFTGTSSNLHVQLAFGAFTGLLLGVTLHLIAVHASSTLIGVQVVVLFFLAWEYFGPDLLTGTHWYNSLAFCEWFLCGDCAVALWMLAGAVERRPSPAGGDAR